MSKSIGEGPSLEHSKGASIKTREKMVKNDSQLAKQFFIMNICAIISGVMVIGLGMRYLFPNLNEYYNVVRFLLRTVNLLFQSFIPVAGIYYIPEINSSLAKSFDKIIKKIRP